MGMSPFGGGSCSVFGRGASVDAPNPDPLNFQITNLTQVGKMVVASIKYPDCINFEGLKICLFENTTVLEIENRSKIDPHFSEGLESPVARFRPDDGGVELAVRLAFLMQGLEVEEGVSNMNKLKMTVEDACNMFPVGAGVKYFPIFGEEKYEETKIRSEVWALGHGDLAVKVEGRTGCVCISHLEFL